MRPLNKREKILIVSFFIVFLLYIVSTYWIRPLMQTIDNLQVERDQLKNEWDQISKWVGQENTLREKITALETAVNQEMDKVAPANQSALYWNAFNKIAGETGTTLTRMDEGKDQAAVGKTRVFTLGVSGSESAVLQFIARMQSMAYVTAVKTGTMDYTSDAAMMANLQLVVGSR